MKLRTLAIAIATLTILLCANFAAAETDAHKSFDLLKSMEGKWSGKNQQGQVIEVTFRSTAGGSAIMSEIHGHGPENMITMFHMDGDRLLMTHYCGAGNQPRMTASTSPDGKTISFDFFDATNLATPDAGHMQRVVFTIVDANHHTEDWTFAAGQGKEMKEFFDLKRKM